MDLIEDIGPILGIVAFLGFAILALLIVLQAREVRRLREWAGRAPERAVEADEAALAASEEKGELEKPEKPVAHRRLRDSGCSGASGPSWDELDRRSPVDPRLVSVLLVGVDRRRGPDQRLRPAQDDDDPATSRAGRRLDKPPKVEVAVLNATQQEGVADPSRASPTSSLTTSSSRGVQARRQGRRAWRARRTR